MGRKYIKPYEGQAANPPGARAGRSWLVEDRLPTKKREELERMRKQGQRLGKGR